MLVIGLAGGIGSGKSYVAQQFVRLGARLIDADGIGHAVLRIPEIVNRLAEVFGRGIIDDRGEIQRPALAALVFSSPPEGPLALAKLESVTHPLINAEIHQQLQSAREQNVPAVILDAAVMFRAGWDRWCDRLVFVEADAEIRWARTAQRGWTREQWQAREASQLSLLEKKQRSTDLISNNGNERESVPQQILRLWKSWGLPADLEA